MEKRTDNSSAAATLKDMDGHKPKKRRLHGACDGCRKKKSASDSPS
jgi:hypothetical protein